MALLIVVVKIKLVIVIVIVKIKLVIVRIGFARIGFARIALDRNSIVRSGFVRTGLRNAEKFRYAVGVYVDARTREGVAPLSTELSRVIILGNQPALFMQGPA